MNVLFSLLELSIGEWSRLVLPKVPPLTFVGVKSAAAAGPGDRSVIELIKSCLRAGPVVNRIRAPWGFTAWIFGLYESLPGVSLRFRNFKISTGNI